MLDNPNEPVSDLSYFDCIESVMENSKVQSLGPSQSWCYSHIWVQIRLVYPQVPASDYLNWGSGPAFLASSQAQICSTQATWLFCPLTYISYCDLNYTPPSLGLNCPAKPFPTLTPMWCSFFHSLCMLIFFKGVNMSGYLGEIGVWHNVMCLP